MTAADIGAALGGRRSGDGWQAQCPAHDDNTPSLTLTDRGGRVLVRCHAGCEQRDVIAALRERGLWPARRENAIPSGPPDHVWLYHDATGAIVRRTARWDLPGTNKTIRPQIPDGRGSWRIGDMRGHRPLYRLPEVLARPDAVVLVTEGERAADAAQTMLPDYVVTTSAGGARAAERTDWSPLRSRAVTIWRDADAPGADYAADVARLARAADVADVRVVTLPAGLPAGWDLADPLPAGWTVDTVRELIAAALPSDGIPAGRRARLMRVADVAAETITWLWLLRLARGKLTLLAGDPGAGKTYIALAVSAALSRAWPLPGETAGREPCDIVYMTREDGIGDTLRPRLDALGADVERVHVLTGADDGRDVSLADIDVIGDAVAQTSAALVVVDPLQSWLGSRVDAHRANETRPLLDALGGMCARYRCACLVNAHTAKARGGRPVTAALGSIDFAGAARVMLIAGTDPHDRSRSVLAGAKTNIGAMPASIAYTVDRETGAFAWGGAVELSAADVLAGDVATEDERDALSEAVDWLHAELADGARPAREMERAARAAGIAPATLRRARRAAGVQSHRQGFGRGAEYAWALMHAMDAHAGSMSTHDAHGEHDDVETGVI